MVVEGVLGRRPDLHFTSGGKAVCNFDVDGTRCVAWEELAENISEHVREGDKVKVFGYSKERWWTLSGGEKRSEKEFVVNRIKVLERPKPIENCCYYCKSLGVDCLKACYNAMGGPSYMEVCEVENGKCVEENIHNEECFEVGD